MDAGGQKGEALQQALHVRILALARFEQQAPGHLGVLVGEFRAEVAEVGEFLGIVEQQIVAHGYDSFTLYAPLAISRTVSKEMRSGAGSTSSTAST